MSTLEAKIKAPRVPVSTFLEQPNDLARREQAARGIVGDSELEAAHAHLLALQEGARGVVTPKNPDRKGLFGRIFGALVP